MTGNVKSRKKSPLGLQTLRSSRKSLVKTRNRFSFPLRSHHGSTISTRRSLRQDPKRRHMSVSASSKTSNSKADGSQKTNERLRDGSRNFSTLTSNGTASAHSVAASIQGRRISNRQRKPSCRLNFSRFQLTSRNTTLKTEGLPTVAVLSTAVTLPSKKIQPKIKDSGSHCINEDSTSKTEESPDPTRRKLRKRAACPDSPRNIGAPQQSYYIIPKLIKGQRSSTGSEFESPSSLRRESSSSSKSSLTAALEDPETPPTVELTDFSSDDEDESQCKSIEMTSPQSPVYSSDFASLACMNVRPGCYCLKNENVFADKKSLDADVELNPFCQGIDLMEGKAVGCTRLCSDLRLRRVSAQAVFLLLCPYHNKRLELHHCCPLCGQFCAQGDGIYRCTRIPPGDHDYSKKPGSKPAHLFHKLCAMEDVLGWDVNLDEREFDEEILGKISCPHCGGNNCFEEVSTDLNGLRPPVFFPEKPILLKSLQLALLPETEEIQSTSDSILSFVENSCSSKLSEAMEKAREINVTGNNFTLRGAIENGDLTLLVALLLYSDNSNSNELFDDLRGQSLLHFAVELGDIYFVHALVTASANPNCFDEDRTTPLMIAAASNRPGVIKYLIAAGADRRFQDNEGRTVAHIVAKEGHIQSVESLSLETDLDLLEIRDEKGLTPLMVAAKYGRAGVVSYLASLISWNEGQLSVDKTGNTAMHWAAYGGSMGAIGTLRGLFLSPDPQNLEGDTPLHIAVKFGGEESAIAILVSGSSLLIKNVHGKTPMDLCDDNGDEGAVKKDEKRTIGSEGLKYLKAIFNQTQLLRSCFGRQDQDFETAKNHIVSKDISKGREANHPIRCVNSVDEVILPVDFVYVTNSVISSSSIQPDLTYQSIHHCSSNSSSYAEYKKRDKIEPSSRNCSTNSCNCYANNQLRYLNGRLHLPYKELKISTKSVLISECNQFCSCDVNKCQNRVVQKGITADLEVFRTSTIPTEKTLSKSWGVRTRRKIKRGSFVCELVGELISSSEASKRTDHSYMFELYRSSTEENSLNFLMDSRTFGNVSRFLNHSCQPNLVAVKVFVEHSDHRFPRLAFFTNREINSGEELTFDYGYKLGDSLQTDNPSVGPNRIL